MSTSAPTDVDNGREIKEDDTKPRDNEHSQVTMSTEGVVNEIGAKPSPKFLLLVVGLMSFQIMKAMVAYFPNFGGYLPYKEWRCVTGSEDCYLRVNDFEYQGQFSR